MFLLITDQSPHLQQIIGKCITGCTALSYALDLAFVFLAAEVITALSPTFINIILCSSVEQLVTVEEEQPCLAACHKCIHKCIHCGLLHKAVSRNLKGTKIPTIAGDAMKHY